MAGSSGSSFWLGAAGTAVVAGGEAARAGRGTGGGGGCGERGCLLSAPAGAGGAASSSLGVAGIARGARVFRRDLILSSHASSLRFSVVARTRQPADAPARH